MGKGASGSIIGAPDRPMTGQKGFGTFPGGAPSTAMSGASSLLNRSLGAPGGAPPGTAYKRLGTGQARPGSNAGGPNASSALRTGAEVQVDNRPLTQHGVVGIRKQTGTGGRQILDKNYFVNELRQKRLDIANVTQKMRDEVDALTKRQAQFQAMDKRCADLTKEVKQHQESLADFNTVLDKVGSQTPTYDISREHAAIRERNDALRRRVDGVLTDRLSVEQKARAAENRFQEIQNSMDGKLNELPPSQRQIYYALAQEQAALTQESKHFEESIDALDRQLAVQEGELGRNPLKQKALQLQEQIQNLKEKKAELQQEEDRSKQWPEEQREQLMAKIKSDNASADQFAHQARELQDYIKRTEARLHSLAGNGPAVNAAEEAAKREKFQELVAKERDLSNFMDGFPSRKAAKVEEMRAKQDAIVAQLEKINKLVAISEGALPSTNKFKEMQDELEYKQMQLENTQMTQERLKEELLMRQNELEKIDTLEEKIKSELQQLAEKSEQIQKQTTEFADVEEMRTKAEANKARLEQQQVKLLQRKDMLRQIVGEKTVKYQAKKAQLQENAYQVNLEKLENKLRNLHTNIFQMTDTIKTKESETNYKGLALNIAQLTEELNNSVKRAMIAL
eukprot:CAMPEP_0202381376 /NCGR_PEP_ID=MMETSP1127-20130417/35240_1 /ASSEMBLY_ACC=CAM_ASM_000462 /TAXON_ID=3047 /ORGANISM="Dunaliella tertiolecta, Strain CCMP1320" /LENGTH=623 /DNA_ID=CAMNT_0048980319 /DNA_START=178 /DNA_END=2049 /DNA_ORIENTATION=+